MTRAPGLALLAVVAACGSGSSSSSDGGTTSTGSPPLRAKAPPPPEPEKTWDGCAALDPNPWPWRPIAEGMWGEDPRVVPDFGYDQERRAPKMPDADKFIQELGAARGKPLTDALLICHVEVYSRNGNTPTFYRYKLGAPAARTSCGSDWDTFGAPDVLVRLRLRDDYPIALFGPEDHWGFFISIPRVSLAVGDKLAVKLWDRDSGNIWSPKGDSANTEFMGEARLVFDGTLPMELRVPFFTLRCNAMSRETTRTRAQTWLAGLDRDLDGAAAWRPDPAQWQLGANSSVTSATMNWGRGNFRYPAGFLGWDHAEIQRRLERLRVIVADEAKKRQATVAELAKKSPRLAKGSFRLEGKRGALKVTDVACQGGSCVAELEVTAAVQAELCDGSHAGPTVHNRLRIAAVDADGNFQPPTLDCPTAPAKLHATYPTTTRLLWLGAATKPLILATP